MALFRFGWATLYNECLASCDGVKPRLIEVKIDFHQTAAWHLLDLITIEQLIIVYTLNSTNELPNINNKYVVRIPSYRDAIVVVGMQHLQYATTL